LTQPDAETVHAQFDRIVDVLADKLHAPRHRRGGSVIGGRGGCRRRRFAARSPAVLAERDDERTERRRYIGRELLRQSRLTVIDGDAEIIDEEVLPAITTQHSTTDHVVQALTPRSPTWLARRRSRW
jgi:hypothetical protein